MTDKEWQIAIVERDPYCTIGRCMERPSATGHHLYPKGRRPDLRHDLENGIGVCHECHDWLHNTAAGKAKNYRLRDQRIGHKSISPSEPQEQLK